MRGLEKRLEQAEELAALRDNPFKRFRMVSPGEHFPRPVEPGAFQGPRLIFVSPEPKEGE